MGQTNAPASSEWVDQFNRAVQYSQINVDPIGLPKHASTHATGGSDPVSPASIGAAPATGISPSAIIGTAVVTTDSRLSDARTPTSHASTHAVGGSDPVTPAAIGVVNAKGSLIPTFTSASNIGVGDGALNAVSTGLNNTAIGQNALLALGTGGNNVAIGTDALGNVTGSTKASNVAVGFGSGSNITSGASNVCLGRSAGPATNLDRTIAIGRDAAPSVAGQIAIGSSTYNVATLASAATPATAQGFLNVKINGTDYKIPYYTP